MKSYDEFKAEYVRLVTEMLDEPVGAGPFYIGTRRSRVICSELANLEEKHPVWTERVEDWLAEQ